MPANVRRDLIRRLKFKVVPLSIYTLSVEKRVNIMVARDMTGK